MNNSWQERSLAALSYLLPMAGVVPMGFALFREFPVLVSLFLPLIWVNELLRFPIIPIVGISLEIVLFFSLYGFVVQNPRISRFIRLNAMQSLLLSLVLTIASLLLQPLVLVGALPLIVAVLYNTTFLGIMGVTAYAVWACSQGNNPEIPGITEAAQIRVR